MYKIHKLPRNRTELYVGADQWSGTNHSFMPGFAALPDVTHSHGDAAKEKRWSWERIADIEEEIYHLSSIEFAINCKLT